MTKARSRTKARSSQVDKGGNIPNREGDKEQAIGSDAGKFEGGQERSTSLVRRYPRSKILSIASYSIHKHIRMLYLFLSLSSQILFGFNYLILNTYMIAFLPIHL